VVSVALKTPIEIRLGICIYKLSLLHRPWVQYIGFTPSAPPTFYNKIAPMPQNVWFSKRGNGILSGRAIPCSET